MPKKMRSASEVLALLQSPPAYTAPSTSWRPVPPTGAGPSTHHGLGTITLDDLDGDPCIESTHSAPQPRNFSLPNLSTALHSSTARFLTSNTAPEPAHREQLVDRRAKASGAKMVTMLGGVRSVTCSRAQGVTNPSFAGDVLGPTAGGSGSVNRLQPRSPGELTDIAEEEERQMLARMEARCKQAKSALKQTELPGSRQSNELSRSLPFAFGGAANHQSAANSAQRFAENTSFDHHLGDAGAHERDWSAPGGVATLGRPFVPPSANQLQPASGTFSNLAQKVSAANQAKLVTNQSSQGRSRLVAPLKVRMNPRTILFPSEEECKKPTGQAPQTPHSFSGELSTLFTHVSGMAVDGADAHDWVMVDGC